MNDKALKKSFYLATSRLSTLTASKLDAHIEKLQAFASHNTTALIHFGFGHVRGTELRAMVGTGNAHDALLRDYAETSDWLLKAHDERSARLRYQGTTRPIKPMTW